jgi:hypothetical protein
MLPVVHAVVLAALLLWPGAALPPHRAAGDTTTLQFFGFRAGARLDELSFLLSSLSGDRLRCRHSKIDSSVSECRAAFKTPELGRVDLWVSAIDSLAGVMTLSGPLDFNRLDFWREELLQRYGRVAARVQGTQSMLQWVRRGRMLRLTWRLEAGRPTASVSLVDGHVLDAWGRARSRPRADSLPAQPPSRTR